MKIVYVFPLVVLASCGLASDKRAAIFAAVAAGDVDRTRAMARAGQVDKQDSFGQTPLMFAARQGKLDIVKVLLQEGADIDVRDQYSFTVIDQLDSIVRRTGQKLEAAAESMRKQGLSEKAISGLVASSAVPGNLFDGDLRRVESVLHHLKAFRATVNKKREAGKRRGTD